MQVMTHSFVRWTAAVALAGGAVMPVVCAEESQRALPTLLIKGEIVSVDTTDPAAALLKVKDRYGFETPIYLTQETAVRQGEQTLTIADLAGGTPVEVEYNFDINTAKRHAVNVSVSKPVEASPAPAAPAEAPAASAAPAPESAPSAETAAPAPASSSDAAPAAPVDTAPSAAEEPQPAASPTTTP